MAIRDLLLNFAKIILIIRCSRGVGQQYVSEIIPLELEAASTAGRNLSLRLHTSAHIGYKHYDMKVHINRLEMEVEPTITTLAQLLKKENLDGPGRAVAIDNKLVARADWENTILSDCMNITVIRAVCGG